MRQNRLNRRNELIRASRRALTAGVALAGVLALAPACSGERESDRGGETEPGTKLQSGLSMNVRAASPKVTLGDDIVFQVTLKNHDDDARSVGVPRIGRNSLSFRVRRGTDVARLERFHAELVNPGRFKFKPNSVGELDGGAEQTWEVRTPAIQTGEVVFTPQLARRAESGLTGDPIQIMVEPDGQKRHIGVAMSTSKGDMTFRLRPDLSYTTVESFISLTKSGFFDGLTFHRILAGFMAQGGDPQGTGTGGPGYYIPGEMHEKLLHDRGVLSMARTGIPSIGRDTAGSQFFILFARRPDLDPGSRGDGYTTFGEMLTGEEALAGLEGVPVGPSPGGERSKPLQPVDLAKVTVITLP